MTDKDLLGWLELVATKFAVNHEGWVVDWESADLKHIRYHSDYRGYNHWFKRLKRGLRGSRSGLFVAGKTPWARAVDRWFWLKVSIEKEDHLPDATLGKGIIASWAEDAEYIALMQPLVGMQVIKFVREQPDNEYAKLILAEMHKVAKMSWPKAYEKE